MLQDHDIARQSQFVTPDRYLIDKLQYSAEDAIQGEWDYLII